MCQVFWQTGIWKECNKREVEHMNKILKKIMVVGAFFFFCIYVKAIIGSAAGVYYPITTDYSGKRYEIQYTGYYYNIGYGLFYIIDTKKSDDFLVENYNISSAYICDEKKLWYFDASSRLCEYDLQKRTVKKSPEYHPKKYTSMELIAYSNGYLYFKDHDPYSDDGVYELYVWDIRKNKIKKIYVDVGAVEIYGNHLYYASYTRDIGPEKVYQCKMDGSGRRQIIGNTLVKNLNVSKGTIKYNAYSFKNGKAIFTPKEYNLTKRKNKKIGRTAKTVIGTTACDTFLRCKAMNRSYIIYDTPSYETWIYNIKTGKRKKLFRSSSMVRKTKSDNYFYISGTTQTGKTITYRLPKDKGYIQKVSNSKSYHYYWLR